MPVNRSSLGVNVELHRARVRGHASPPLPSRLRGLGPQRYRARHLENVGGRKIVIGAAARDSLRARRGVEAAIEDTAVGYMHINRLADIYIAFRAPAVEIPQFSDN